VIFEENFASFKTPKKMNTAEFLMRSPLAVPLTQNDQQKLRHKALLNKLMAWILLLLTGYFSVVLLDDRFNEYGVEKKLNGYVWLFDFLLLLNLLLLFFLIKTIFKKAENYGKDIENANKQIGIVQVVAKRQVYNGDNNSSCYVHFKWCNTNQQQEIIIDNYDMYTDLSEGDKAYLEFVPVSECVLQYHKKRINLF
jgi:hypothetical protein